MPPTAAPSNIRAFVHWRETNVYAGDEIECIITFKNIAKPPGQDEDEKAQAPVANGLPRTRGVKEAGSQAPSAAHSRNSSFAQSRPQRLRTPSAPSTRGGSLGTGHRPALSLSVVSAGSRGGLHSAPLPVRTPNSAVTPGKGHGRSLSIMSLGSDVASEGRTPSAAQSAQRPARGHGRSASLQVVARPPPPSSPGVGPTSSRQPSPLYEIDTPPALPDGQGEPPPIRPPRKRPGTVSAGNTPHLGRQPSHSRGATEGTGIPDFRFPAKPPGSKPPSPQAEIRPKARRSPCTMHAAQHRSTSPRPPEGWSAAFGNLNPVTRVMSESSIGGTPRASSEFYSMSNHSDETLTSETPQQNGRLLPKAAAHSRQSSHRGEATWHAKRAESETLMMGFAQTMGSFTLDGSLVNAAPFEEVKRKGVQGGGGVVGLERSKRSSGMFGAFSWGNIGESLGGLLGGDEMSSIGQMKAVAGSKSVPLLSTPQSLLFVDLRLAPGESRSYNYRFHLPRGLPPSHRGRAMKVKYHLALGIQRPDGQTVRQIEVPFRVLGSYNARGETLGHDLMSPYILLNDAARTQSVAPISSADAIFPRFEHRDQKMKKEPKQGLEDFLRYTERLLEHQRVTDGELLSPTSPNPSSSAASSFERSQSNADLEPVSIKEGIDLAILRSNLVDQSSLASNPRQPNESQSVNRFNIARSGQPVAVLTLLRPAYKLGEPVIGTIDLTHPPPDSARQPHANTYAVLIELESAERVDPSLALRSGSSIHRVTRKIHASSPRNTIFARRISFHLPVSPTATPTFETTGVSLVWSLRVEFTVQRQVLSSSQTAGREVRVESVEEGGGGEEMLEQLGTDERGTALIARERLLAETFEVAVPVRIYGAPAAVDGAGEGTEALEV